MSGRRDMGFGETVATFNTLMWAAITLYMVITHHPDVVTWRCTIITGAWYLLSLLSWVPLP